MLASNKTYRSVRTITVNDAQTEADKEKQLRRRVVDMMWKSRIEVVRAVAQLLRITED